MAYASAQMMAQLQVVPNLVLDLSAEFVWLGILCLMQASNILDREALRERDLKESKVHRWKDEWDWTLQERCRYEGIDIGHLRLTLLSCGRLMATLAELVGGRYQRACWRSSFLTLSSRQMPFEILILQTKTFSPASFSNEFLVLKQLCQVNPINSSYRIQCWKFTFATCMSGLGVVDEGEIVTGEISCVHRQTSCRKSPK